MKKKKKWKEKNFHRIRCDVFKKNCINALILLIIRNLRRVWRVSLDLVSWMKFEMRTCKFWCKTLLPSGWKILVDNLLFWIFIFSYLRFLLFLSLFTLCHDAENNKKKGFSFFHFPSSICALKAEDFPLSHEEFSPFFMRISLHMHQQIKKLFLSSMKVCYKIFLFFAILERWKSIISMKLSSLTRTWEITSRIDKNFCSIQWENDTIC